MSYDDYSDALRAGQREYRSRLQKGNYPYLPNLDEILSYTNVDGEVNLGVSEIPLELIVGTKTKARTNSFAANFMPLLDASSEFASKWIQLCSSLKEEGLREPVKAYEFMNRFYVLEGNKRISVLKFLDAYSVPCAVTRVLPRRTDSKESKIYSEFLTFYADAKINYIYFSETGRFSQLIEAMGLHEGEAWTLEQKQAFESVYVRFRKAFESKGGGKLPITVGDALLAFITVYGYEETSHKTAEEMKQDLAKIWDEFLVLTEEQSVELLLDPPEDAPAPNLYKNLLNLILPDNTPKLKIAFFYEKDHRTSGWTYSHELGRLYLEGLFSGQLETASFENIHPGEDDLERMEAAIADGYNMIFATTPVMMSASLKIAANYPEVKILNCSLNISHPTLRTYYGRMYEAKFLAGVIAGSLTTTDKIGYIADYPIYGMAANINAFALGARMVNPNVKIYLDWSTFADRGVEITNDPEVEYVMGQDMSSPSNKYRDFGLYRVHGEKIENMAMTAWHWGKLYEKIVRTVLNGTWKDDDIATGSKAINYWWGMSAGVVELICSRSLPKGTKRLVDLLCNSICSDSLAPFSGEIYAQDGTLKNGDGEAIAPQEIITMDWLADNVVGRVPTFAELSEEAQAVARIQGLDKVGTSDENIGDRRS